MEIIRNKSELKQEEEKTFINNDLTWIEKQNKEEVQRKAKELEDQGITGKIAHSKITLDKEDLFWNERLEKWFRKHKPSGRELQKKQADRNPLLECCWTKKCRKGGSGKNKEFRQYKLIRNLARKRRKKRIRTVPQQLRNSDSKGKKGEEERKSQGWNVNSIQTERMQGSKL